MAESTDGSTAHAVIDASTGIPSEILPLLAEMAKADSDGQFITLELPVVNQQATGDNLEIIEQQQPSTSRARKPRKEANYVKSRRKRRKMELYVREHRKFVHIGDEIERWDRYRKELRVKSDKEFAKLLLDGFRKYTKVVQLVVGPTFGFPEVGSTGTTTLQPQVDPERGNDSDDLADYIEEVQQGLAEAEVEVPADPGASQDNPQNGGTLQTQEVEEEAEAAGTVEEEMSSEGEQSPGDDPSSPSGET